jgi:ketosteroid isomerase-like protein
MRIEKKPRDEPTLPAGQRDAWAQISELDASVEAALQTGDYARLDALAAERHRRILDFFEAFTPTAGNADLRAALLRRLMANNDRLLRRGRDELALAAGSSAATRKSKRALSAYNAQQDGAES